MDESGPIEPRSIGKVISRIPASTVVSLVSLGIASGSLAISARSCVRSEAAVEQQSRIVWVGSASNDGTRYFLHLKPTDPQTSVQYASLTFPTILQGWLDWFTLDLHSGQIEITRLRAKLGEIISKYEGDRSKFVPLNIPLVIRSRYTVQNIVYSDVSLYLIRYARVLTETSGGPLVFKDINVEGILFERRMGEAEPFESVQSVLDEYWPIKKETESPQK